MICGLHLGVLQGTGSHCKTHRGWGLSSPKVHPPIYRRWAAHFSALPPVSRDPPGSYTDETRTRSWEHGAADCYVLMGLGHWKTLLTPEPRAPGLTQQGRKDGAVHRVHQQGFFLIVFTSKRKGHAGLEGDQQRAHSWQAGLRASAAHLEGDTNIAGPWRTCE